MKENKVKMNIPEFSEKTDFEKSLEKAKEKALKPKIDELTRQKSRKKRLIYAGLFIFGLIIINLIITYPLFTGEYNQYLSSSEGSIISQSKFISENFLNHSWNPLQNLGFPSYLFSAPVVPYLLTFLNKILVFATIGNIYRILIALFAILGPVFLFLFDRSFS